jgi:hypothetical protein
MKPLITAALLAGTMLAAQAGTPLPAQIVYGRVRDAYGFPYLDSGRIVVRKGAVECARFNFGAILSDGMNFRLALDMDSGGSPYAPYAVQTGDALTIAVEVGGISLPLIPTNRLIAGSAGSAVNLDLCTGTDADGDGLPDEWERLLCEQSGGRLGGIADVKPNDDFDGDGLSNRDEFRAGTLPFLATDVLQVSGFDCVSASRIKLRFLTSLGQTYRLIATESLAGGSWVPLRFSVRDGDPVSFRELVGDGSFQTLYIETSANTLFLRLAVQEP